MRVPVGVEVRRRRSTAGCSRGSIAIRAQLADAARNRRDGHVRHGAPDDVPRTDPLDLVDDLGSSAAKCFGVQTVYAPFGRGRRTRPRSRQPSAWSPPEGIVRAERRPGSRCRRSAPSSFAQRGGRVEQRHRLRASAECGKTRSAARSPLFSPSGRASCPSGCRSPRAAVRGDLASASRRSQP